MVTHWVGRWLWATSKMKRESTPGWIRSGSYEIEVATERFSANVRLSPPYDPKGEKIKA